MDASRNVVLAVLAVLIAAGLFYIIDPTLGGLLKPKYEGFYSEDALLSRGAPSSMVGPMPDTFPSSGGYDRNEVENNEHNVTPANTTESPLAPVVKEGFENSSPSPMPFQSAEKPANCYPKNQLAPQELLPNDPNSKWAQVNPMGAGDIAGKNFLNAGALIGVNTVGQSLRNASWDLRSEPPNPQVQVSPWQNSTIEPDTNRRVLEIA
jgi:hypothetical protein